MVYYVTIDDNQIVSCSCSDTEVSLAANERYISEDIYNKLVRLPATFETDEHGNIISVTPAPEPVPEPMPEPQPQPPSIEERLKAVEDALLSLL